MRQVTLVGLSRSPAAKQREFAAELVKQLQELAGTLAVRPHGDARQMSESVRGADLSSVAWRTCGDAGCSCCTRLPLAPVNSLCLVGLPISQSQQADTCSQQIAG